MVSSPLVGASRTEIPIHGLPHAIGIRPQNLGYAFGGILGGAPNEFLPGETSHLWEPGNRISWVTVFCLFFGYLEIWGCETAKVKNHLDTGWQMQNFLDQRHIVPFFVFWGSLLCPWLF